MKRIFSALFILFIGSFAFAQSADVITEILGAEQATYGQVCYLSAIHQGLISDDASYEDAVNVLLEKGQIPEDVGSYDSVYMANLAFIYAQIWPNMKGGLMFRLTKGSPRYAFKQFQADGILSSRQSPSDFVSGAKALSIYTSCVNKYSEFNIKNVSMESE